MIFRALQQSSAYTTALQSMGIAAACDPTTGIHYVARGPVVMASRTDEHAHMAEFRRQMGRKICIVNPTHPVTARGFRQLMTPASVAIMDLTQPISLHQKARNSLHKAERSRMVVAHRPFCKTADDWLLQVDLDQQHHKKFRALPHGIINNWPPDQTRMFTAKLHGSIFAAMVFLIHGKSVTYQLGWSGDIGRGLGAHQLLLSNAAAYFADQGCVGLDLGTIDSVNAPGLAWFKRRAGGIAQRLGGTWAALPVWRS